jgi:hypothetical protein
MTKLANAVFTLALDAKLRARHSRAKALCAAPGLSSTNLQVTTAQAGGFADAWIMRFAQVRGLRGVAMWCLTGWLVCAAAVWDHAPSLHHCPNSRTRTHTNTHTHTHTHTHTER